MRKQARVFLFFVLAFFCISATVPNPSHQYHKIDDVSTIHKISWDRDYQYDGARFEVELSLFLERGERYDENIARKIDFGTNATFEFAKIKRLPIKDCRDKGELDIFAVSMSTLNDKERFSEWQDTNGEAESIVGLYDPVFGVDDYAVILLTEQNNETVAHEVAHYWFDRLCWDKVWDGNTEHFAQALEKYYIENKM